MNHERVVKSGTKGMYTAVRREKKHNGNIFIPTFKNYHFYGQSYQTGFFTPFR